MMKKHIASENQTKVCPRCKRDLPLDSYNRGNGMYGRRSICRDCEHIVQNAPERVARRRELELLRRQDPDYIQKRNLLDKRRRMENQESLRKCLLRAAKQRAKEKGLEFNIDLEDIILPERCPLLGIPLYTSEGQATGNSFSIDRLDSSKGYVKGNVWVVSKRANTLKGNATLEELELLVHNLRLKLEE